MNLNVTSKITLGFLAMVLFIVVVGGGGVLGNASIYQRLNYISDEALPILVGSFNQMFELQQANEALFSALAYESEDEIAAERKVFESRLASFDQKLGELAPQVSKWPELASSLELMRQLSVSFGLTARQVMDLHGMRLALNKRVVEEEIRFQGQADSIVSWVQRYTSKQKNYSGIIAARGLLRSLNTHRFQLTNYKRSGDISGLGTDLKTTQNVLRKKFDAFVKVETQVGQIAAQVEAVEEQLYGVDGLVSLYHRQHETITTLRQQIARTHQQRALSRSAADEFIENAKNLVEQADKEAEGASNLSRTLIISLSVGSILVALLVGVITINTIRRPLSQIQGLLLKVRGGDLRVEFDQCRKDEFGELGESLNAVVIGLKDIIQKVSSGSGRLSEVAEQNAATSQQATQLMSEQSQQLELTAAAATEMESSVNEIAHNCGSTLDAAHACESLSGDVNRNVEETLYSIQAQAKAITQAVEVSSELAGYSSDIDTILETIHAIAEQTNLLALNAAIEAARAGDHGRGFAVVADEVRELASRTRNSTQKIQEMVENMQSSIKQVVSVMQDSYHQTDQCVGHANTSQRSLASMNEAISNILLMNTQIAESTQQQSLAVEEVSRTLTTINTAAAETAQGAEKAASSSNELLNFSQIQQSLLKRFSI